MDLTQLQAMGAIVPRTLFKREIEVTYRPLTDQATWANPQEPEREAESVTKKIDVYVRKRNSADMLDVSTAEGSDMALTTILRCICKPDGSPVFETIQQVRDLEPWMSIPLLNVVREVNQYDPKNSPPRTSGGAGSPSRSGGGASRSGKSRSPRKKGRSG